MEHRRSPLIRFLQFLGKVQFTMILLLVLSGGYGVYVDLTGTSVAGVASAVLLLIVLVYFMAQVLLYGAEVIKLQSRRRAT